MLRNVMAETLQAFDTRREEFTMLCDILCTYNIMRESENIQVASDSPEFTHLVASLYPEEKERLHPVDIRTAVFDIMRFGK